jgi:hypothetical protein
MNTIYKSGVSPVYGAAVLGVPNPTQPVSAVPLAGQVGSVSASYGASVLGAPYPTFVSYGNAVYGAPNPTQPAYGVAVGVGRIR